MADFDRWAHGISGLIMGTTAALCAWRCAALLLEASAQGLPLAGGEGGAAALALAFFSVVGAVLTLRGGSKVLHALRGGPIEVAAEPGLFADPS